MEDIEKALEKMYSMPLPKAESASLTTDGLVEFRDREGTLILVMSYEDYMQFKDLS